MQYKSLNVVFAGVQLLSHVWLLAHPMDCSLPGSSVHATLQARILEWVTISFSGESAWPRDQTYVSCIGNQFFATKPLGKPYVSA